MPDLSDLPQDAAVASWKEYKELVIYRLNEQRDDSREIKARVAAIETDISTIKSKLANMEGKAALIGAIASIIVGTLLNMVVNMLGHH